MGQRRYIASKQWWLTKTHQMQLRECVFQILFDGRFYTCANHNCYSDTFPHNSLTDGARELSKLPRCKNASNSTFKNCYPLLLKILWSIVSSHGRPMMLLDIEKKVQVAVYLIFFFWNKQHKNPRICSAWLSILRLWLTHYGQKSTFLKNSKNPHL